MSENEKETELTTDSESATTKAESKPTKRKGGSSKMMAYTISLLVVLAIVLGVLYKLEKEGRSSTTIFSALIAKQEAARVVATVDGENITNGDLQIALKQLKQMAAMQGVDVADPQIEPELKKQALDVLVNTKLMLRAAEDKGLSVTDEEVESKYQEVLNNLGGAEQLATKMAELDITDDRLRSDIREQLLIQSLIDTIATSTEAVADEEVQAFYDQAGGAEANLPPLEEVKQQIIDQINLERQQTTLNAYVDELKKGAEIEIKE